MTLDNETLKKRLRYQGRQYANGQFSRGGGPSQPHMLEQAADRIEELERQAEQDRRDAELLRKAHLIILSLSLAQQHGFDPHDIIDENSPFMDEMRGWLQNYNRDAKYGAGAEILAQEKEAAMMRSKNLCLDPAIDAAISAEGKPI